MKNKTAVQWLESVFWGNEGMLTSKHLEQALEMEAKQQVDLTNITRLEVINHAKNNLEIGRILTLYQGKDFTVVDAQLQDDGSTLKIFIS